MYLTFGVILINNFCSLFGVYCFWKMEFWILWYTFQIVGIKKSTKDQFSVPNTMQKKINLNVFKLKCSNKKQMLWKQWMLTLSL